MKSPGAGSRREATKRVRSQPRMCRASTSASPAASSDGTPPASSAPRARATCSAIDIIVKPGELGRRLAAGGFLEFLGGEVGRGGVDEIAEIAVERRVELVHR